MQKRHQKSLDYALNIIKDINIKNNNFIDSIWMFGSCARNEENYNSDVDLICVVNKNDANTIKLMREIRSKVINCDDFNLPEIDVCFKYNNGDKNYIPWNDKNNNDTFSKQLKKDAIKIWETN